MPIRSDLGNLSRGMHASEPGSLATFDAFVRIGQCEYAKIEIICGRMPVCFHDWHWWATDYAVTPYQLPICLLVANHQYCFNSPH
jgi:hypothetical protein